MVEANKEDRIDQQVGVHPINPQGNLRIIGEITTTRIQVRIRTIPDQETVQMFRSSLLDQMELIVTTRQLRNSKSKQEQNPSKDYTSYRVGKKDLG